MTEARRRSRDFPAHPYPGRRPDFSFVQDGEVVHRLEPASGGWSVAGRPLDDWLGDRGAAPLAAREPVLAYGSNCCPSKIDWLRDELGLRGPVVVVRARVRGLAAVWAAGFRVVDDQRPATLAAVPEADETHAVWFATADQLAVLDVCEGRGARYELARLRSGSIVLADGTELHGALAYVAARPGGRAPLLVDGAMVRCADVAQAVAVGLTGLPAAADGLDVEIVPAS
ncbi:hypothetical protein SAMN05443575_1705 [Jatrophihabitans endophyticus]|uniref:Gamma-glutamyl cyclotransferase, AIG2-like n=1 Tax=Jatrophihabitans endophyticus TaxID=1206085 RepID=A0A1M5I0H4_9ACTN|nr:gamma-glutamylcyclotransferase family protein [Jatrophihabitans endophyticus]SHG21642.1 hypothetical protein SAMN05443575_1705 [Jatrophihabitans endophyticus]